MATRLKERYLNEITPALVQKFNYTSVMQAPKVEKAYEYKIKKKEKV